MWHMTHDVKIQIRKTEEENSEFCGALSIRVPSTKGGSQVTGLYDAEADASYLGTLQDYVFRVSLRQLKKFKPRIEHK